MVTIKGIDERLREHYFTSEISIGSYVLTGGELAAAVVVDAVLRLIPGVLNDETSALSRFIRITCYHPRFTAGAQPIMAGRFLKYCCREMKKKLKNGNMKKLLSEPASGVPIYSNKKIIVFITLKGTCQTSRNFVISLVLII